MGREIESWLKWKGLAAKKWNELICLSFLFLIFCGLRAAAAALLRKKERTKRKDKWINEWSPALFFFSISRRNEVKLRKKDKRIDGNGIGRNGMSELVGYGRQLPHGNQPREKTSPPNGMSLISFLFFSIWWVSWVNEIKLREEKKGLIVSELPAAEAWAICGMELIEMKWN